jgi:hypothetical protein
MKFFAGVWLPREAMPPALQTVSDVTPLGSAVHAMDISMLAGQCPPAEPLLAMAVWAVTFGWLSVRMFKWEWDRARQHRSRTPQPPARPGNIRDCGIQPALTGSGDMMTGRT